MGEGGKLPPLHYFFFAYGRCRNAQAQRVVVRNGLGKPKKRVLSRKRTDELLQDLGHENQACYDGLVMNNAHIAKAFNKIASILTLQDENPFRIRAYEKAALTIESLSEDLEMVHSRLGMDGLTALPGIGDDLAAKIEELLTTGKLKFLKDLEKKVPEGVLLMMEVEGLGPKRVKFLWQKFKITSIDELEKLAKSGELDTEKGWGKKSVENVLKGIDALRLHHERMPMPQALQLAEEIVAKLKASKLCGKLEIAGSLRRRKETTGDIDILATAKNPQKLIDFFVKLPGVDRVLAKGETKASVHLDMGLDADLRVVDENVFGAALHYFTGSKDHNISIRKLGIKKGLTISEYGVYEGTAEKKGKLRASKTEEDIYKAVGLPYIEPELRENRGELEAAAKGQLPDLIALQDMKGDLHVHSTFSDGSATMLDMAKAAKAAKLQYIVFCDHASPMGMVQGIKKNTIEEYLEAIAAVREKVEGIEIFAGAEVDILEDGKLYLDDSVLAKLDWVTASVHSHFKQTEKEMTKRLVQALKHPMVRLLGHPTARLLLRREGITFEKDTVFTAAAKNGVALEINASVFRLDLNDVDARRACALGAKIAICSDAHNTNEFDYRFGITQARRAWLTKDDVVNTLTLPAFRKFLREKGQK